METSSDLYKITAKTLLQNRVVHWLIGKKTKEIGSKPILKLQHEDMVLFSELVKLQHEDMVLFSELV